MTTHELRGSPELRVEVISPLQKAILDLMYKNPLGREYSSDMASYLNTRSQAIGASLKQLERRGIVRMLGNGLWGVTPLHDVQFEVKQPKSTGKPRPKPKPTPEPQSNGTFAPGDLFEFVGYITPELMILRSPDTQRLYPVSIQVMT